MKKATVDRLLDELFNPTPIVIDDREFQRGMNRVAREHGFNFQMMDGDRNGEWGQITTLPCQVVLDDYMKKAVTQINTYEFGG